MAVRQREATAAMLSVEDQQQQLTFQKLLIMDSSGIFWDNDSLAALLAMELKADLFVLLSDVDGLYSCPPCDPHPMLLHTYVKERHQGVIAFGDKSRMGRGGMDAKVKAVVNAAAYSGTPVVVASGFATDDIIKVLNRERIGTLFHQIVSSWISFIEVGAREMAIAARDCSRMLQVNAITSIEDRRKILFVVADAQEAGYDESLIAHLALKPGKISALANSVCTLADMEEPIGRILKKTETILIAAGEFVFMVMDSWASLVLINPLNWVETEEEIEDLFLGDVEVWRRPSIGHADPLGDDFPLVSREGHNVLDVIFTSPIVDAQSDCHRRWGAHC